MTIRILIADDHEVVRQDLRTFIVSGAELEVVGEAGNGAEAVQQARRLRPDLTLMDLLMPRMDGVTRLCAVLIGCGVTCRRSLGSDPVHRSGFVRLAFGQRTNAMVPGRSQNAKLAQRTNALTAIPAQVMVRSFGYAQCQDPAYRCLPGRSGHLRHFVAS